MRAPTGTAIQYAVTFSRNVVGARIARPLSGFVHVFGFAHLLHLEKAARRSGQPLKRLMLLRLAVAAHDVHDLMANHVAKRDARGLEILARVELIGMFKQIFYTPKLGN